MRHGIASILIPLVYLAVVLWMDAITPHTPITPLFGIFGLMVFSFIVTPGWMILWAAVYAVTVTSSFMVPQFFHALNPAAPNNDHLTPLVRSATFIGGAALSAFLNRALHRMRKANATLREILKKIPQGVVASDADGKIHFMNEAAIEIAGLTRGVHAEGSFFDLFSPAGHQGATIAAYLRRFGSLKEQPPMILECNGQPYKGLTQMMDTAEPVLMITMLQEVREGFPIGGSFSKMR